ncbi:MAG: purine-nucleoside phosphorylase [Gammaproteobacteria bacterium]|nr:purine-nucleoside phosphorylase [Gammaproteobacteria bacterium]
MPTPHNSAKVGEIAKTVLMPGDPLRAQFIAEKYLENVKCVNSVRNMYAFTGTYKGKEVTVMGSGMGMPSISIYSYELYKFYGVENIIRCGSAGSYVKELDIFDVVLADSCFSESSYAKVFNNEDTHIAYPSKSLVKTIEEAAKENNIAVAEGRIHSSDVFYHQESSNYLEEVNKNKCLAVEMESFALFTNAKELNKHAACILTISDSFVSHKETTPEERQKSFDNMIKLALEAAIKL